ncbi:hypothetical protein ACFWQO_000712 [Salmonella enterica]|nr:hypothetical protein [Salmonella enterica subsp. enterica serovar Emek]
MKKWLSVFLLAGIVLHTIRAHANGDKDWSSSHIYKCDGGYTVSFRATNSSSDVVLLKNDSIISRRSPQQIGVETLDNRYITNIDLTDIDGLQGLSDDDITKKLLSRDQYVLIGEGDFDNPGDWVWGLKIKHQMRTTISNCNPVK